MRITNGMRVVGAALVVLLLWSGLCLAQAAVSQSTETELAAARAACASNVRQIALAIQFYAADHDGRLPRASSWQDDIRPYLITGTDPFHCPSDRSEGPSSYAYNWMVAGLRLVDIADPAATVLVFESETEIANQADSAATIPPTPRHETGNHYGFADGHVELLPKPPNFLPTYAGVPGRGADHKEQLRQLRALTETFNEKLDAAEELPDTEAAGVDYYQVRQSLERAAMNMDEAYNRLAIVHFQRRSGGEGLAEARVGGVGGAPATTRADLGYFAGDGYLGAQGAPSQLITLEIENQRFPDVLMRLARQTQSKIVASPDGIPEGRIYCLLQQVTFEEALARLCEAVGAEYTVALSPVPGSEPVYVVCASGPRADSLGTTRGAESERSYREGVGEMLGDYGVGVTVLDFTGADFRDVVDILAKRYHFSYRLAPEVPDGLAITVSPPVRVSSLEEAVGAVAAASGTVWTRADDGGYLITPKR